MHQLLRVLARFVSADPARPLPSGLSVRLMDEDLLKDDFLHEATLQDDGRVEFTFDHALAHELRPDMYMVLEGGNIVNFRTEVFTDVNFFARNPVTGMQDGLIQDLGTFTVPVPE